MSILTRKFVSAPLALAAAVSAGGLLMGNVALASDVATDVKCKKCVDKGDIAKNAVDGSRIKDGAVTPSEIKAGKGIIPILSKVTTTDTSQMGASIAYVQMQDIGTFIKVGSSTDVKISLVAHGTVSGTFCDFQLRVDGFDESGSDSTDSALAGAGRAILGNGASSALQGDSFNISAVFQGLEAGNHDIEIWGRGVANTCTFNTGGFPVQATVEEYRTEEAPDPNAPA